MVSVMKSPNMMSTTGRRPVMAASTATPVNPASEIGVSTTRFAPNSSTSPERTLKGVPASATSSPMTQTRESRRISSASASRTACANVSSRSGIDVLLDFVHARIRRVDGELHRRLHDGANIGSNSIERGGIRIALLDQPFRQNFDGVAVGLPETFFLLGAVIFTIDVADVVSAVSVSITLQKCGAAGGAGTFYQTRGYFVDGTHILAVDANRLDAECGCPTENGACGSFLIVGVLVV